MTTRSDNRTTRLPRSRLMLLSLIVALSAIDSFVAADLQSHLQEKDSDNGPTAQYLRANYALSTDESQDNSVEHSFFNMTNMFRKLIYGGKTANDGEFFWFVELAARDADGTNTRRCGATMISQDMAVTAANCLYDITGKLADPGHSQARLMRERTVGAGKGVLRRWKRAIPHEDHYYPSGVANVGVIQFTEPIFPTRQIAEINTDTGFATTAGYILWAVGLGRTSDGSMKGASSLQWGEFEVVEERTNNCRTGNPSIFLCVQGRDDSDRDMCRGDEGSALIRAGELFGIYSHGGTCGNDDHNIPIFIRTDFYRGWINGKACEISNARCIGAPCGFDDISLISGEASPATMWQAAKFYATTAVESATTWLFPPATYGSFAKDDDFYSH